MTLATTAASLGLKVLGNALQDPRTRGQLKSLASQAGQLVAGKGFAKAIENGLNKVQTLLDDKADDKPAASVSSGFRPVSTETAQTVLTYFDTNRDGQVSKGELTEGALKLEKSGLAGQGAFREIHQAGQALLKQYDGVASLDGQAGGISSDDIQHLAALDKAPRQLSATDLQQLAGNIPPSA